MDKSVKLNNYTAIFFPNNTTWYQKYKHTADKPVLTTYLYGNEQNLIAFNRILLMRFY